MYSFFTEELKIISVQTVSYKDKEFGSSHLYGFVQALNPDSPVNPWSFLTPDLHAFGRKHRRQPRLQVMNSSLVLHSSPHGVFTHLCYVIGSSDTALSGNVKTIHLYGKCHT